MFGKKTNFIVMVETKLTEIFTMPKIVSLKWNIRGFLMIHGKNQILLFRNF